MTADPLDRQTNAKDVLPCIIRQSITAKVRNGCAGRGTMLALVSDQVHRSFRFFVNPRSKFQLARGGLRPYYRSVDLESRGLG